ncbi:hypothetical protein HDV02_001182, partial [Globomyces sp. JEL0801]
KMQLSTFALAITAVTSQIVPCTNPTQHVEWREMTKPQKLAYIEAIKCLHTKPSKLPAASRSASLYDDLVDIHRQVVPVGHGSASFLPWHRLMLAYHDAFLKSECKYTGPMAYWDWTADSQAPELSSIWDNTYGFGGNGDARTGCIPGPFASTRKGDRTCIQRRWDGPTNGKGSPLFGAQYSPVQIQQIMTSKTYDEFRRNLEGMPHNSVHNAIGGEMRGTSTSVNDPIFFLHHRNVDRLWYVWQTQNKALANTYGGRGATSTADMLPMYRLAKDIPVSQVLNTTSGGANGMMCYTYSNSIKPADFKNIKRQVASTTGSTPLPFDRTDMVNIRYVTPISDEFFASMNMTQDAIDYIRHKEAELRVITDKLNASPEFTSKVPLKAVKNAKNNGWVSRTDQDVIADREYYLKSYLDAQRLL